MAYTNQTEYYHLPQYLGSDRLNVLTDTNEAYETIDTALHGLQEDIDAIDVSVSTTTLTAKGLTFAFTKKGGWCHVRITGTLTDAITNGAVWSETVPIGYVPQYEAVASPTFPADINNSVLGISMSSAGAIQADCVISPIASGNTIDMSCVYMVA